MNKEHTDNLKPDLHLQIKEKRLEKKLSQMKLAAISKLSMTCIQKLESGKNTNISLETLGLISNALDFYDWNLNLKKA